MALKIALFVRLDAPQAARHLVQRYTAMSFLVAGHRSSRFAPQRFGSVMRRAVSRRSRSCMRSGVVPGAHVVTHSLRCRSAVPTFTSSPAPSAADRASRMPAPHSVVVTASASCTAPAMLLAFSFRAVPMSRPCHHQAFKRHNTPLKSAPFGRSDAPQAARRLAARWASQFSYLGPCPKRGEQS